MPSRSWDVSAFSVSATANTTPTLSKRRGMQFRAASKLTHDPARPSAESDTPFPQNSAEDEPARRSTDSHTQRTVRRKKSSLDLRDVFLSGGMVPSQSPPARC